MSHAPAFLLGIPPHSVPLAYLVQEPNELVQRGGRLEAGPPERLPVPGRAEHRTDQKRKAPRKLHETQKISGSIQGTAHSVSKLDY